MKSEVQQTDKQRTPAQLWSRRETITRKIAELQAEYEAITAQLAAELQKK